MGATRVAGGGGCAAAEGSWEGHGGGHHFKRMVAMDELREDGMEEGQNKDQHRDAPPAAYGAPSVHARDLTDSQHTLWGWCHPCLFQKKKLSSSFLYDFMYVCVVWLWVGISLALAVPPR